MLACFRQGMTAAQTVERVKAETGEEIAERTIGRRKAEWEAEQERRKASREQMEDLLAAMKAGNHTASEMVNALAVEAMMRDPDVMLSANPVALQQTSIAAERVRLQREQVELKKRQLALDEAKFDRMKQREEQTLDAAKELKKKAAAGESIAPEDLNRIFGIYGLSN